MDWRIFFIGPMGIDKGPNEQRPTIDYRFHLPRLHEQVVERLQQKHKFKVTADRELRLTRGDSVNSVTLKKGHDRITAITPFDLYGAGDIPENVFDAIDDSDLVIADLSGNKPAVIYELAFTHALGIETILVGGPETRSFYLSQSRIAQVDFDANPIDFAPFHLEVDGWLAHRNKLFNSKNPLQRFYGAPLPDISAANGLAAGFYDNFARPVLSTGQIVLRERGADGAVREETRDLKGLIVLRPKDLELSVEQLRDELQEALNAEFPGEVRLGGRDSAVVRTKEGERTAFFTVRDYVIDIPRTMFSLKLSPRLRRMIKSGGESSNMQGVLIGRFFEGVKSLLGDDHHLKDCKQRFHAGDVSKVASIIKTGKSKTWA